MSVRVLVLSYDMVPGISAVGQHLAQLIPALAEQATVDAMSLKREHLVHIQKLGEARLMRVPTPGEKPLERLAAFARAAHRQLDSDSYDLVLCSDLFAAQAVASHPGSDQTPLLIDLFSFPSARSLPELAHEDAQMRKAFVQVTRQALTAAKGVICHSPEMRQALINMGLPESRLVLAPIGLDTKVFVPPKIEIPSDPSACVVTTVMEEPSEAANSQVLLDLWNSLPRRLKLVLLTHKEAQGAYQKLVQAQGLTERVKVKAVGSPEDLAKAIRGGDIQLCWHLDPMAQESGEDKPQNLDASSILAFNALLCGRPVVSTGCGTSWEIFAPEPVQKRDPAAILEHIASQIAELATSSALRTRVATRSRELLLDRVNPKLYTDIVFGLIEKLCHERLHKLERESDFDPSETGPGAAMPIQKIPVPQEFSGEVTGKTPVMAGSVGAHEGGAATEQSQTAPNAPLPDFSGLPEPEAGSTNPAVQAPGMRALALGDSVDQVGKGEAIWDHDTVAMPMEDIESKLPVEQNFVGMRSMDVIGEVDQLELGGLETEIMSRDDMLDGDAFAGETQRAPRLDVSTEETVRIPMYTGPASSPGPQRLHAPLAKKDPAQGSVAAPAPILFDDPAQPSQRPAAAAEPPVSKVAAEDAENEAESKD